MPVVYALCLARGGSKGIPKKNVQVVCGKELLRWCMDAAVDSKVFSRVFVSTDSAEIARVAIQAGYEVHERDASSATDFASSESGIKDFLDVHPECDVCCLLQATSPLTRSSHLVAAYEQFTNSSSDSLVTVVRTHRFLWKIDSAGVAMPLNYDPRRRPRRQDWIGELGENGSFYFFTRAAFESSGSRLSGKITAFEMPAETLIEIDEPEDLMICEQILARSLAAQKN